MTWLIIDFNFQLFYKILSKLTKFQQIIQIKLISKELYIKNITKQNQHVEMSDAKNRTHFTQKLRYIRHFFKKFLFLHLLQIVLTIFLPF